MRYNPIISTRSGRTIAIMRLDMTTSRVRVGSGLGETTDRTPPPETRVNPERLAMVTTLDHLRQPSYFIYDEHRT